MRVGVPPWTDDDLRSSLREFSDLYSALPIRDNSGGNKSVGLFYIWFCSRHLDPKVIIENGVWKGATTWLFETTVPDAQIYSGGFFSNADYDRMDRIRKSSPKELSKLNLSFDDTRLPEMLFRYRARNFPESLNAEEKQRWNDYRKERFTDPALSPRTLNHFLAEVEELQNGDETTGSQLVILEDLLSYAETIKNY